MSTNPDSAQNIPAEGAAESRENIHSQVLLHIMRHSQGGPKVEATLDYTREISDEGKKLISDKPLAGAHKGPAVAFGSSRVRSQQTAALLMENDPELLTKNFQAMYEEINKELPYGSRIGVDERLNYDNDPSSPYVTKALGAKEYLKYIVEESDGDAKRMGYTGDFTYTKMAANIAKIVKKYATIADRWDNLVDEKPNTYQSNTLERFLGTHQAVPESFLAKLIETKNGVKARDEFVQALGNQGFDMVEGFDISITNTGSEKKIVIHYSKKLPDDREYVFQDEITPEELDEIVQGGLE